MQDRQVDFNVKEYRKLTDMLSNSTLQITFKKLLLVESRYGIKHNICKHEKAIKIFLPFPTTYLHEAGFSSNITSTKTTYGSILNEEANTRTQLFSLQGDIKEICKNINQCHSHFSVCLFWKYSSFFIKYIIYASL